MQYLTLFAEDMFAIPDAATKVMMEKISSPVVSA